MAQPAEDGSDWFCYHSSSRLIFPINFCTTNHIPLSPPLGYQEEFDWEKYLLETNSTAAPREIFQIVKVIKEPMRGNSIEHSLL